MIFLPGIVLPAPDAFASRLAELGTDVDAGAKDLEVCATSTPPPGYSLDVEVAGVLHAERLRSLALLEPAWAGNWGDAGAAHQALWPEYVRLAAGLHWMAQRPGGVRAIIDAFLAHDLDRDALRRFDRRCTSPSAG